MRKSVMSLTLFTGATAAVVLSLLTARATAAGEGASAAVSGMAQPMIDGPTGVGVWLAVLPIMVPLFGAALTLTLHGLPRWQAPITLATLAVSTVAAAALAMVVLDGGPLVMAAGNWTPPFGIVIAVDELSAILLLVTCIVGLVGLAYARADVGSDGPRFGFYTFYCLLIAGVCGAFSTGDIFNLYVWFEVFLISSFGLVVFGGERVQMDGAVKYGVLNLIATTMFLIAVGALYGVTGTLNMADIRGVLADSGGTAPLTTIGALFVLAFAMKAAAFPLHFWLPASYHTPKIIVGALFAGLLTKVAIYSLLRVMVMLFGGSGSVFLPLLGWVGFATAILGAVGALAQSDLRRMAAFLVVSGVGVMLIGFGIGGAAGFTGTIVYAVHSIVVMTALFLVVGVVERVGGAGGLFAGSNLYATHTALAGLFLVFGLSAAGLPPFSGFWPKLILVDAAIAKGGGAALFGAFGVIVTGLLTMVVVGRVWALVFLRAPDDPDGAVAAGPAAPGFILPLVVLAILVVGLGVFPQAVVFPAEVGAAALLDPSVYVERVLSRE